MRIVVVTIQRAEESEHWGWKLARALVMILAIVFIASVVGGFAYGVMTL